MKHIIIDRDIFIIKDNDEGVLLATITLSSYFGNTITFQTKVNEIKILNYIIENELLK